MELWQKILHNSITTLDGLHEHVACDSNALPDVIANFPMRINPYFLKLIQQPGDPIWKQAVPDLTEIHEYNASSPPLWQFFLESLLILAKKRYNFSNPKAHCQQIINPLEK